MSYRDDAMAILRYENYRDFPLVHFGYWPETIVKWMEEGHITEDEAQEVFDNSPNEVLISRRLGFDFNWNSTFGGNYSLCPAFQREILETTPEGYHKVLNEEGVVILEKPGVVSIPTEIDHLLKDRESWELHFKHRLTINPDRVDKDSLIKYADDSQRETPMALFCGSLYGNIRNYLGIEGSSYLYADDEELYDEIIETNASMTYETVKSVLELGVKPDFAHFWEDICFKNGPLISPRIFAEKIGPWYRKFADLMGEYGIDIISVDCDGKIDDLIPIWLENGVNTMFPIEVGTWGASIAPWREKYGKSILGIGGMNKTVFAQDYKAIDREIERLKPLVALGGYIPCPDHRIAPDAKWENVQYYCENMRKAFS